MPNPLTLSPKHQTLNPKQFRRRRGCTLYAPAPHARALALSYSCGVPMSVKYVCVDLSPGKSLQFIDVEGSLHEGTCVHVYVRVIERDRDRQTGRQTEREGGRERGREGGRDRDRDREREREGRNLACMHTCACSRCFFLVLRTFDF